MPITNLTGPATKNYAINGNFDFWQRGTVFNAAGTVYSADRFRKGGTSSGTANLTRQSFTAGQTDVPNEPTYYFNWAQTVASSTVMTLVTRLENVRSLANKTVSLSFWARLNSGSGSFGVTMTQSFGTGGSASVSGIGVAAFVPTSLWQRFTFTFLLPSISGQTIGTTGDDFVSFGISFPNGTTWNLDLAQVMINEGNPAAFQLASGGDKNFQAELALCQRYYEKSYATDVNPGDNGTSGSFHFEHGSGTNTTNRKVQQVQFNVKKRATPTMTYYDLAASPASGVISVITSTGGAQTDGQPFNNFGVGSGGFNVGPTGAAATNMGWLCHWTADADL